MFEMQRKRMVRDQIKARGVKNSGVLRAMEKVERHRFVDIADEGIAYGDFPINIGQGQTISQPYIVAHMTELLQLHPGDSVLEIGTGSGYQTAVLAECCSEVYSVELNDALSESAKARLNSMGYKNIHLKVGDGFFGWPGHVLFDAILVAAAPPELPSKLIEQLKTGGRLVIPVGDEHQQYLKVITREPGAMKTETLYPVRFVPMVHPDSIGSVD